MGDTAYRDSLAETFHHAYKNAKLDVVVASSIEALQFVIQYRDKILPGVPIVFYALSAEELELVGRRLPDGVTGRTSDVGLRETIDLALRLNPDAQAFAVVTESPDFWWRVAHSELNRHRDRVKEVDLFGAPGNELLESIAALPPNTLILFQLATLSAKESVMTANDVLAAAAKHLPTYCAWKASFILGCIGGAYVDWEKYIESTAETTARVLSGERPENIPVVDDSNFETEVDWRALQRWHIPESALPPGSQVLYREPSLWEQGRKYFLGGIAIIVAQSLLIFGLFWHRARLRKAELELAKSEKKFSKAFRESPLAIKIVRVKDDRYLDVNDTFEVQTGWKRNEVIGRTVLEADLWVNPDERTTFIRDLLEKGSIRDLEFKVRRKDGQIRTFLGSSEVIEVDGEPCVLSVIADVTERKLAEEALASLSGRLIEAQEAERARIARELHDDINQRLAMVAVSMKTLKEELPKSPQETSRRLEETCAQLSDLEGDVQALSHRLHSPNLEYFGLEETVSSFCREFSEQQNVKIDYHCNGLPEDLPGDVSLCFFRVLQEALHNAVKYSGVDEFEVSLDYVSHDIQLKVHDSGVGFDPTSTVARHGLGLISMQERLKLVSGEFSIHSKPWEGTTILARVPIPQRTSTTGAVV